MYVPRKLAGPLRRALTDFPAVLVTGPRQSGKTTFLRAAAGQRAAYVSLDDPFERGFAVEDPNGFLDRFGERAVILDEIQQAPTLLPHLKLRIDAERSRAGRWLLSGSQQFALMAGVSESLAGRVAILQLLPFAFAEAARLARLPLPEVLWRGGYPEPALRPRTRDMWMRSYVQTYLERDLRQLRHVADLRQFETVVALAAGRHAQETNFASLAREAGVTQPTVRAWLGLLEAAYLVRLLPPYHRNFGKRTIKSPRLVFLDSGLLCALTRQPSGEAALAGAMGGAIFEGWVVSEAIKCFANAGLADDVFFWRSQDGVEVDLVARLDGRLVPIEAKLTASPSPGHVGPIRRFIELAGVEAAETGLLVCQVKERKSLPGGHLALPWGEFPAWLEGRLTTKLNGRARNPKRVTPTR